MNETHLLYLTYFIGYLMTCFAAYNLIKWYYRKLNNVNYWTRGMRTKAIIICFTSWICIIAIIIWHIRDCIESDEKIDL